MTNKEFSNLFKFLQSICHIWDNHELGLVKKERALQELLQDCRKDHDNDNQVSLHTTLTNIKKYFRLFCF